MESLDSLLRILFTNMATPQKAVQIGSAMSLTRVTQNVPPQTLSAVTGLIAGKINELMQMQTCKCQTQLLECIISLVLNSEG